MLTITKIFRFEAAHALHGYSGACGNIHGHSYELHVTLTIPCASDFYPAPGFPIDYKELKNVVEKDIIEPFDHSLLLSKDFLEAHPMTPKDGKLVITGFEPSSENLLIYIRKALKGKLPFGSSLSRLRLYETTGSYAEWEEGKGN